MRFTRWAAVVVALVLLVGCGPDDGSRLPNPSAVFCEDQGGTYSLEDETCTLPDGDVVDAWDYFRERAGQD